MTCITRIGAHTRSFPSAEALVQASSSIRVRKQMLCALKLCGLEPPCVCAYVSPMQLENKTVLVTGGAGFIGANFLRHCVPAYQDTHFINFDLLTYAGVFESIRSLDEYPNYDFQHGDIASHEQVRKVFADFRPDIVVHFAAESHVDRSIRDPALFLRTNIMGTFELLSAAVDALQRKSEFRFHHVSTDEVYGSLGNQGLFTEQSSYNPSSPYSASKASSDHLVRAFERTYGLPVTISNCSNNYGPYQFPEKLIPLMLLHASEGQPLPIYGDGTHIRDWLFVKDHVSAILAILERGKSGQTYNVGGDSEKTNLEVIEVLCRSLAKHLKKDPDTLLSLRRFVKDRPGHDKRYAIDASKIKRELGWKPFYSFEEGVETTILWYMENPDWVELVRSGEYQTWVKEHYL